MSRESKLVLLVGLIIYAILEVLLMIRSYDSKFLSDIFKISSVSIHITSLILFAYVLDRGNKFIAIGGLACIAASMIYTLLQNYGVISLSINSTLDDYRTIVLFNTLFVSGIGFFTMLALLSLMDINSSMGGILYIGSIISYMALVIFTIIVLYSNDINRTGFVYQTHEFLTYLSNFLEYSFIIVYLLNKECSLEEQPVTNNNNSNNNVFQPAGGVSFQQNVNQAQTPTFQVQQPVLQQVQEPVIEQSEPVVEQPKTEPQQAAPGSSQPPLE